MTGSCHYCRREMQTPTSRSRTRSTRDHLVPRHMGGRRTVRCCWQCNQIKGPLHIAAWKRVMERYPLWWKRFRNFGDLDREMRNERWAEHRRLQEMGKWPRSVSVVRASSMPRSSQECRRMKWLRLYLISREIDHNLKQRRIARQCRSEAAQRGVSTYWHNSARRTREMFGEAAA